VQTLATQQEIKNGLWELQSGGTFTWTAPEILLYKRATFSSDVFSFGVILWYGFLSAGPCVMPFKSRCRRAVFYPSSYFKVGLGAQVLEV
jgi:serine/threonine protein kinase